MFYNLIDTPFGEVRLSQAKAERLQQGSKLDLRYARFIRHKARQAWEAYNDEFFKKEL